MAATVKTVAEFFRKAEARLKRTEGVRTRLTIAAVNELRYAGQHLLASLEPRPNAEGELPTEEERAKQLQDSEDHAKRALYDAAEAELLYRMALFNSFKKDFRDIVIPPSILDFAGAKVVHRAAQELLCHSGEDSRSKFCDDIGRSCEALKPYENLMEDARDELNKQLRDKRRTNRTLSVMAVAAAVAAAAAVVAQMPQ